jgi:hypothetical protein
MGVENMISALCHKKWFLFRCAANAVIASNLVLYSVVATSQQRESAADVNSVLSNLAGRYEAQARGSALAEQQEQDERAAVSRAKAATEYLQSQRSQSRTVSGTGSRRYSGYSGSAGTGNNSSSSSSSSTGSSSSSSTGSSTGSKSSTGSGTSTPTLIGTSTSIGVGNSGTRSSYSDGTVVDTRNGVTKTFKNGTQVN